MSFLNIPYEIKNGVETNNCCSESLLINLSEYPLCGEKYFVLRIINVSEMDGKIVTTFEYNGDTYGVYSISSDDLISLLNTAFVCPENGGNCSAQNTEFTWALNPITLDEWSSDNIVNEVANPQPDTTYTITSITIDGTPYVPTPHLIWDDSVDGNATQNTKDYIDAIIAYIEGLSIPQYKGAVNHAKNDMVSTNFGDNLLSLYFTPTTTVLITIVSALPLSGTFNFVDNVTAEMELTITDTSTLSVGDNIIFQNNQVSDGFNQLGGNKIGSINIPVYSLFLNYGLNISQGWIINETIATQNECVVNNLATAIIQSSDIKDCLYNKVAKSGTSIN